MTENLISSLFHTSERYLRSVDLVRDFEDPTGLEGYFLTEFGKTCIKKISDGLRPNSVRRAWRLTGDFGSGKSAFALFLAKTLRKPSQLPKHLQKSVNSCLSKNGQPNLIPVLVTGTREPISNAILRSLQITILKLFPDESDSKLQEILTTELNASKIDDRKALDLIKECNKRIIKSEKGQGILLILDEVGKFLEFAALNSESQDVFFLQQLAEIAARSGEQALVILCLLHQGFNAYSEFLTKSTQKEWEKIAGRFDEIVFHQPLDQITQLVCFALRTNTKYLSDSIIKRSKEAMEHAIELGWFGAATCRTTLRENAERIYPIDPMVLPVLVRFFRKFGQNERSLFSFLSSYEPFGLQAFSNQPFHNNSRPYQLSDFYDYVRANFGHRLGSATFKSHWNIIESTIENFQANNELDLRVLKTIGLLNLLNSDDLLPTEDAIYWSNSENSEKNRHTMTEFLFSTAKTPVLHFRGKGRGFSVWAHTSVDLDERLNDAKRIIPSVGNISEAIMDQLTSYPIVARGHYIQTGNLRYFDIIYCQPDELVQKAKEIKSNADGFILIPLCETPSDTDYCKQVASDLKPRKDIISIIAVPKALNHLHQAVLDAKHWEWVQTETIGLNNDKIARDEVAIYLQESRNRLSNQIHACIGLSRISGPPSLQWFYSRANGSKHSEFLTPRSILKLLSSLCDDYFPDAPRLKNELINRHSISSAAAAARMRLIELMFSASDRHDLGMPENRKPPEKSMYFSILKKGNIHFNNGGSWQIGMPKEEADDCAFRPVLKRIKHLLATNPDSRISVREIFNDLRKPPFGIREGVLPLFLAVIAIEGEHEIAFFENGTFLRELGREAFLRLIKAPEKFDIQFCRIEGVRSTLFEQMIKTLEVSATTSKLELLDVVRNLCQFVARLPEYSRNTRQLAKSTLAVRHAILDAREPVKLVFYDLPAACGFEKFVVGSKSSAIEARAFVSKLKESLDELRAAFPSLQQRISTSLAREFNCGEENIKRYRTKLAARSEKLLIQVTENKLKAFIFRLFDEALPDSDWLNSVGSLLALRPPDKWKDEDEDRFNFELETIVRQFKRVESLISTEGTGQGIRVAVTQPNGTERHEVVHVDSDELNLLKDLQKEIAAVIKKNPRLGLAAASHAIWSSIKNREEQKREQ